MIKNVKLKDLLEERYINLFDKEDMTKYGEEVWKLIQQTYAPIGGYPDDNIVDLIKDTAMWKLVRKNGKIVAFCLYKDKSGRKSIAGGSDGSSEGKKALFDIFKEDFRLNRSWAEVSGKLEQILLANFKAQPLPNTYAQKLTGKKILSLNSDGVHYTRLIGGEPHEKMILTGDIESFVNKYVDDDEED